MTMFGAADIEAVTPVPGGVEIEFRGEYGVNSPNRQRTRIELSWSACERLVRLIAAEAGEAGRERAAK